MNKNIQLAWQAGRRGAKFRVTGSLKWFIAIGGIGVFSISRHYQLPWHETALLGLFLVVIPAVIWTGKNQSRS